MRPSERSEARTRYHGLMIFALTAILPLTIAFVILAQLLVNVISPLVIAAGAMLLMFFIFNHERWYDKIAKALNGNSDTKVDKLGKAIGLKFQRIPERQRWVTRDTPDPEPEEEQPQILDLPKSDQSETQ